MAAPEPDYDIAIVGGGISGIYAAWRLLTSDLSRSEKLRGWAGSSGKLRVAVFEGSHRIGGRLLSARPPGMPSTIVEIGGMRFVSSQTLVQSLVLDKLKLPVREQVVDCANNIAYLRGKHLRMSQLQTPSVLPYSLEWAESQLLQGPGGSPSTLIGWAITQILPEVGHLNGQPLREFLRSATVDGLSLYQHGFWNLLARAMSLDAYELSRTMVGYDCLGNNANAVDLTTCYFDFTPDVKYYLINGGYETVPWTLQTEFEQAGGNIFLGASLKGFDATAMADGSMGSVLRFCDGRPEVRARAIVLAMPTRSLKLLRRGGPVLDPEKSPAFQALLESVEPIPLYKQFIGYPYPWWEAVGVTQGRSMTDMPLRQCYYWAENAGSASGVRNTNAVAMVYDDAANVDFWGGLSFTKSGGRHAIREHTEVQPRFVSKGLSKADAVGVEGNPLETRLRQNWADHEAPAQMVAETHRQLILLHNAQYAPEPTEAAFVDWSADPYGGGVHFWRRGYKSWVVLDEMTQPEPDFPCYVCGEAYSTNQTWVEGALQTAELVLQKGLGLLAPAWVP